MVYTKSTSLEPRKRHGGHWKCTQPQITLCSLTLAIEKVLKNLKKQLAQLSVVEDVLPCRPFYLPLPRPLQRPADPLPPNVLLLVTRLRARTPVAGKSLPPRCCDVGALVDAAACSVHLQLLVAPLLAVLWSPRSVATAPSMRRSPALRGIVFLPFYSPVLSNSVGIVSCASSLLTCLLSLL